jgi:hypothetical protein
MPTVETTRVHQVERNRTLYLGSFSLHGTLQRRFSHERSPGSAWSPRGMRCLHESVIINKPQQHRIREYYYRTSLTEENRSRYRCGWRTSVSGLLTLSYQCLALDENPAPSLLTGEIFIESLQQFSTMLILSTKRVLFMIARHEAAVRSGSTTRSQMLIEVFKPRCRTFLCAWLLFVSHRIKPHTLERLVIWRSVSLPHAILCIRG